MLIVQLQDNDIYMALVFVTCVIYPLQSTLNPILYSMVAKKWRTEMKDLAQSKRNRLMDFFELLLPALSHPPLDDADIRSGSPWQSTERAR